MKYDGEKQQNVQFFLMLNKLPEDIIKYIQPFIPLANLTILTKSYYTKYHCTLIKPILYKKGCDTYIRYIIRNNFHFLFETSLYENFEKWVKLTKYLYKMHIYSNYIYFLLEFCIENESVDCRRVLQEIFVQKGFNKDKNIYKNKTTAIIWRN